MIQASNVTYLRKASTGILAVSIDGAVKPGLLTTM